MKKCKITVLKREFYPELEKEYIPFPDFGPCEMMNEGMYLSLPASSETNVRKASAQWHGRQSVYRQQLLPTEVWCSGMI
ncbi:MAG: hypothetical protein LIO99_08920 [Clostridiales bacterium]|nr:hypothetical protein [Clostridiales bacterium]